MTSFLLDPVLVTIPDSGTARVDVESWLRALSQWNSELQYSDFEWRQILRCSLILAGANKLVTPETLRQLFRERHIDASPQNYLRVAHFFLDDGNDYLHRMVTKDATSQVGSTTIEPSELMERNYHEVQSSYEASLLSLAIDKCDGEDYASKIKVATLELSSDIRTIRVASASALVEQHGSLKELHGPPVEATFDVVITPDDLLAVPPHEVMAISAEEVLRWSIRFARNVLSCATPHALGLHHRFEESLASSGIRSSATGIDKIARLAGYLAAQHETRGMHRNWLRIDARPTSPQRVREADGALAWRVRITDDGVGWRLNYWHVPAPSSGAAEVIQLAWVEAKSERAFIPE